ncbi:unnamed protein product [Sphagnum jensenii]|uniref:Myosin motor domain-containing protein n=1 Tax=Sphagnum jensenii TaxID=128206 RepID=A0ABP0V8J1_9BRYO
MENELIVNQLRSLGILQTCEVLKLGMPTRLPYKDLIETLAPIIAKIPSTLVSSTEQITLVACILHAFEVKRELYKLGRTRIFFRAGQFELIERILQATREGFKEKQGELIKKITEAANFRKQAEKMIVDLTAVIAKKQQEITHAHERVKTAIDQINNSPARQVQVPSDLADLLLNCERMFSMAKALNEEVTGRGTEAVAACSKVLPQLGPNGQNFINVINKSLDTLHNRILRISSRHLRTVTRFDALLGRNDRVKDVANSLEDVLNDTQSLLAKRTTALSRSGMAAHDVTSRGVDVGIRLVKGIFAAEMKTLEEITRDTNQRPSSWPTGNAASS